MRVYLCLHVTLALARAQSGVLKGLTDSPFDPPLLSPPAILVGGTQVAMTPDCFVCPLTSLRGSVVNQALHVRGKQKGGEGRGCISSVKIRSKRFLYTSALCRAEGGEPPRGEQ